MKSAQRDARGTHLAAAMAAAGAMVCAVVLKVGLGLPAIHAPQGYLAVSVRRLAQTRFIAVGTGAAELVGNAFAMLHLVGPLVYPALMPTVWKVAMQSALPMSLAVGRGDVNQMARVRVFLSSIAAGSAIL